MLKQWAIDRIEKFLDTVTDPASLLYLGYMGTATAGVVGIIILNAYEMEKEKPMFVQILHDWILLLFLAHGIITLIGVYVLAHLLVLEIREGIPKRAYEREMNLLKKQIEVELLLRKSFGTEQTGGGNARPTEAPVSPVPDPAPRLATDTPAPTTEAVPQAEEKGRQS